MIKFLVDRPIAVIVSFFALLLLGITAHFKLPISLLPELDIPNITVRVVATDLSVQEVENRMTKPLRNSLLQLRGLQDLSSKTAEGNSTISLTFDHGTDISRAFVEVNEKVDMAMGNLPRESPRPLVVKSSISDIPVFRLNVFPKAEKGEAESFAALSSFSREIVRRRIEQIPEVAMVDITGFAKPQVVVSPKFGYLESIGIQEEMLTAAFKENSFSIGNILVKDGHYRYYLRFSGEMQDLKALNSTPINVQGRVFRLGDLADISYTNAEVTGAYYSGHQQAINFAIIKQSAARMEDLKANFQQLLTQMEQDYPDIGFELTQDQTELLDFSINNLQQDLILGGVLAFLLMLVFIRKVRMALLIAVTIPLSLVISQLGFFLFGISLNVISLGGLILGLSMIIDNSIVVMDTISEHRNAGMSLREAAIAGANEIIRPLITSVLTNCAVFIPLIFMSGLAGAIFYDQAISIIVGVLASLLVSVVLLPPLFSLLYGKGGIKKEYEIKTYVNFTAAYDRVLKWSFRYPVHVLFMIIVLSSVGAYAFTKLPKNRLPDITRYDFELALDWNEYIDQDEIEKRLQLVTEQCAQSATDINIWSGQQQYMLPLVEDQGYSEARIYVRVATPENLKSFQASIGTFIKSNYPLTTVSFYTAKNAFDEIFKEQKPPLLLMVSDKKHNKMPNAHVLNRLLDSLSGALPMEQLNPIATYEKLQLRIDHEKAARYGLTDEKIIGLIKRNLHQQKIADYQASESLIPIVLKNKQVSTVSRMLSETFVKGGSQQEVPLSAFISVDKQQDFKYIIAGSFGEYYPLAIHSTQAEEDLHHVKAAVEHFKEEVDTVITGNYFDNKELIKEMGKILLISILLLYFILAAQFESLIQPLFILVELPIAMSGAFIFLYLAGNSINLMSMIGIIVMSGLIINDSILKIDAINQLRRQGVELKQAIFEGGHKRLRSILMISFTSVGALCPTLFMHDLGSELQTPLVLTLIGGMLIGLLVSLFFMPIVYWWIYKRYEKV